MRKNIYNSGKIILQVLLLSCFFLIHLCFLTSCASKSNAKIAPTIERVTEEKHSSELRRPISRDAQVITLSIPRSRLLAVMGSSEATNSIRVLKVYDRYEQSHLPEYRIFDVQPGSIFQLLGFQQADIIVSGEGYAFSSPRKFSGYVSLLRDLPSGEIEIRRGSRKIVFEYKIVE